MYQLRIKDILSRQIYTVGDVVESGSSSEGSAEGILYLQMYIPYGKRCVVCIFPDCVNFAGIMS